MEIWLGQDSQITIDWAISDFKESRLLDCLETGSRKTTFVLLLCCSLGGSVFCLPCPQAAGCLCQQEECFHLWGRTSRWRLQWGPNIQTHLSSYFHVLSHMDINTHLYPLQALWISQIKNTIPASASCGGTGLLPPVTPVLQWVWVARAGAGPGKVSGNPISATPTPSSAVIILPSDSISCFRAVAQWHPYMCVIYSGLSLPVLLLTD